MSLLTTWVDRFVDAVTNSWPMDKPMKEAINILEKYETHYGTFEVLENHAVIRDSFSFKVVQTRAAHLKLPLSDFAIAAIALIAESPGNVVMYLTALKHLYAANVDKPTVITTKMLMNSLFDYCRPSASVLGELWDAQKVEHHNLLDLVDPETDFILDS